MESRSAGRDRVPTHSERKGEHISRENVDLVTGGYDDFNSGNIEGVTARFHPEIQWVEPGGGNAPSGTFRDPAASPAMCSP